MNLHTVCVTIGLRDDIRNPKVEIVIGAKIMKIGDNVKLGAGLVVLKSIFDRVTAVSCKNY